VDPAFDRGVETAEDPVPAPSPETASITHSKTQAPTQPQATASNHPRARQRALPIEDDLFSRIPGEVVPQPDPKTPDMRVNGSPHPSISVRVGSTVRLQKLADGHKLEITLVETDHDPDRGMIGIHTPLGEALLDAQEGDEIEYRTGPYLQEVRVLRIK
jgi:hypothetical protein